MKVRYILLILVIFLVSIASAVDTDSDGLDDLAESELGTDVADMDTDDDGYSDGVEVEFGSDPLDEKDTPDSKITGGLVTDAPIKSYIIALLVLTILAQGGIFMYLRRKRDI